MGKWPPTKQARGEKRRCGRISRNLALARRLTQNECERGGHATLLFCAEPMPAQVSETFVLRTYPFREADLIVSFFTRDLGKLRGVARRARKPKSPFGAGLERLSRVNMAYYDREGRDLSNLSGCELIDSPFALQSDYTRGIALDYFAEIAEQLLPPHEPNEKFFRLLASALDYLGSG